MFWLKTNISNFLYSQTKSATIVKLSKGFKLPETVIVKGVNIHGAIACGDYVKIIDGVYIQASKILEIGSFTSINGPGTDIINKVNEVRIGKFCSIARGVAIQEFNHSIDRPSSYFMEKNVFHKPQLTDIYSNGPIDIGNDVWIGAQCIILGGSKIGHGAVIAANSVVSGEIPPYAIVGGSPAKILRYRFEPELIDRLLKLSWWDWPLEKLRRNEEFFTMQVAHKTLDSVR